MTIKDKLVHAATEFDRKASKRKGHNIYALPQYFMRIDEICADIESGADARKAIVAGFSGRLLDTMLRGIGLPLSNQNEAQGGSPVYSPVSKI